MTARAIITEPHCDHIHDTIEAVCPRCGKPGDAICPHCRSEYEGDCLVEDPSDRRQRLSRMAQFARYAAEQSNPNFWWACYLFAVGDLHTDGITMGQLGRHFGVGKACVSKTCVEICARLNIQPSQCMRNGALKRIFKRSNVRPLKEQQ